MRKYPFPETQYVKEVHPKTQIYLHHTAGNPSAENVFNDWAGSKEKIGTFAVISGAGEVVQGFDPKYWAFHLGLKESSFHNFKLKYRSLDKTSIGIEICNWGQVTYRDRKFYTYVGREISSEHVRTLPATHRGHRYFHDYTALQISALRNLLLELKDRFKIPLTYNPDIWDVSARALSGKPGLFTHNSVRYDKTDVYPHPGLIEMLKTL